jgi:hypothetical protein
VCVCACVFQPVHVCLCVCVRICLRVMFVYLCVLWAWSRGNELSVVQLSILRLRYCRQAGFGAAT